MFQSSLFPLFSQPRSDPLTNPTGFTLKYFQNPTIPHQYHYQPSHHSILPGCHSSLQLSLLLTLLLSVPYEAIRIGLFPNKLTFSLFSSNFPVSFHLIQNKFPSLVTAYQCLHDLACSTLSGLFSHHSLPLSALLPHCVVFPATPGMCQAHSHFPVLAWNLSAWTISYICVFVDS